MIQNDANGLALMTIYLIGFSITIMKKLGVEQFLWHNLYGITTLSKGGWVQRGSKTKGGLAQRGFGPKGVQAKRRSDQKGVLIKVGQV